jgi:maltooligosyltrehalose trehalohydrolase
MTRFAVWAPKPKQVALRVGTQDFAMQPGEMGWWWAETEAAPGADYGFSLDGGTALPDPRSRWQPNGIHGLSRLLNTGDFRWTDDDWRAPPLSSAVIYELHIGTFTPEGTFEAAIARLDDLAALGITHVELMPVAEFPGARGWGYDGVDLYAPHHAYGGPHGLARLVEACHARGLAVVLDVVYNHLGPDGNYLGEFGPYFTERYRTPWGAAVNFDEAGSDEVRRFFVDNARQWLEDYHLDGLRLDAVHAIFDASAQPFLEELGQAVHALQARLGRPLVLIAESDDNKPQLGRPREAGGLGLDAVWNDDFHHALHSLLTGERQDYYADFGSTEQLAKVLQQPYVYDGQYSAFRGRRHGRPAPDLPAQRLIGYLQNHDQVGKRAAGERTSQLLSPGLLKIAAALVLAGPRLPMLFMGEEWGASTPFQYFTDHQDPELARAVSEGRRKAFAGFVRGAAEVPDPQSLATFERSRLDWDERGDPPQAELLEWHRRLIALRHAWPELTSGFETTRTCFDSDAGWLIMERADVWVVCNLARHPQTVPLACGVAQLLLAATQDLQLTESGIVLPGESVAILGMAPAMPAIGSR